MNVPVDTAPTVNTLTRSLNDAETITIKFKRTKQYKKTYDCVESSRLSTESKPSLKEANIQVDTSWLDSMYNLGDDDRELVRGLRNDGDLCSKSQAEGESEVNQIYM